MSSPLVNHNPVRARLGAAVGLLLCLVLGPLQSSIWNGAAAPAWAAAIAAMLLPPLRGAEAAAAMAQPPGDYFFYGRFFLLVYAGLYLALRAMPLSRRSRSGRLLTTAIVIAAVGDFLAYWVSAAAGPSLRHLGFWNLEVPALFAALLLATALGVQALRSGTLPRHVAWCFAAVAPAALLATAALRYMPHGPMLALAAAVSVAAFSAPGAIGAADAAAAPPSRAPRGRRVLVTGAGLVAALVAVASIFLPYRPVVVAGAPAPQGPYALPPAVAGLRLHVFNTGMNRMSALLVGEARPWRPAPAFVVEHPRHGLLVFDCGLSDDVAREGEAALPLPMRWLFESRGAAGRTLDAQMREAGFDPGAVPWVVLSHLHDDHTGAAPAFGNATFVGGAGSRGHLRGLASRWREVGEKEAATPLPPFAGAFDLFGDGSVEVIPGGGHTREDLMLLVALPEGPVLLAGDAVVHGDWLAADDVQRIAVDPERAAQVRNQVRALLAARPEVVLFPGHDLQAPPDHRADIVLHHPEWFAAAAWPVSP